MTAPRDRLPLVLLADDPGPHRVRRAADLLGDAARVAPLPKAAAERRGLLRQAEALLVFSWAIPKEELSELRRVRLVQSVWAGADRIPVRVLTQHAPGVLVAAGTGPNAAQVAEHAVGLYLDCAKRITWRDRQMRAGGFPQEVPGRRVAGSRIAVLGYGAIGRRVARAFDALGAEVVAATRSGHADDGRVAMTLEECRELLPEFHGVVLALPLTRHTDGLVDHDWLRRMRADAILVNVARGRLVNEKALHDHLMRHPEFQAGLDVWWRYPKGEDEPFRQNAAFASCENVVMTPHAAFHVPGTRDEMLDAAVANVARFLRGDRPERLVDPDESVR